MEQRYKVLVADDSSFTRRMITSMLEDTEFDVVAQASDGTAVMAQLEEHAPDIILLDVIMPKKDGTTILKEIMAKDADARVLMLSSMGTEDVVTECLTSGARSFIQKPCEKETLVSHMRETVKA